MTPRTAEQMRLLVLSKLDEAKALVGFLHVIQIARIAGRQVRLNPALRCAAERAGREWMERQVVVL